MINLSVIIICTFIESCTKECIIKEIHNYLPIYPSQWLTTISTIHPIPQSLIRFTLCSHLVDHKVGGV